MIKVEIGFLGKLKYKYLVLGKFVIVNGFFGLIVIEWIWIFVFNFVRIFLI